MRTLFPRDLTAPGKARAFVREELERDRLDDATIDSALLLVSELVTNAVRHGAGSELGVDVRYDGVLHVGVSDDGTKQPVVRAPAPLASSGRGLNIVSEVADAWGMERAKDGKSIWFTLRPGRALN